MSNLTGFDIFVAQPLARHLLDLLALRCLDRNDWNTAGKLYRASYHLYLQTDMSYDMARRYIHDKEIERIEEACRSVGDPT